MAIERTVNRKQRLAAASKRRASDRRRMPVEEYRVAAGQIALTFDIHGRDPLTISINASALVDAVEGIGKLVAGKTYQEVLHLLAAVIKEADAGVADAWNGGLLGFWLALNYPHAGDEMVARLSDDLAISGCAHITMHVAPVRGIAFALGDRFFDLDETARQARENGLGIFIAAEPRRQRQGGRA